MVGMYLMRASLCFYCLFLFLAILDADLLFSSALVFLLMLFL